MRSHESHEKGGGGEGGATKKGGRWQGNSSLCREAALFGPSGENDGE